MNIFNQSLQFSVFYKVEQPEINVKFHTLDLERRTIDKLSWLWFLETSNQKFSREPATPRR